MATKCTSIQKSLGWCQGTPELPGVKRRIYFLAKSFILGYPQLPRDELGRATSAILTGEYTLAADAKWKYILRPGPSHPRGHHGWYREGRGIRHPH